MKNKRRKSLSIIQILKYKYKMHCFIQINTLNHQLISNQEDTKNMITLQLLKNIQNQENH